jgi:predicted transcriptional regulator
MKVLISFSKMAYERPSFGYQATIEIIQDLVQKGFIQGYTVEYIKLTRKGLINVKKIVVNDDGIMPDIYLRM